MSAFLFLWVKKDDRLRKIISQIKITPMDHKNPDYNKKKRHLPPPVSPDNPFHSIKIMMGQSVGKIPAGLVFVLVISLAATSVVGLSMRYMESRQAEKNTEIIRIEPSQTSLNMAHIQGIWVSRYKDYVMSLSIVDHRYEWMIQHIKSPKMRYFSRGHWQSKDNVLSISQRDDMGYPVDKEDLSITFMPIPMDNINARLTLDESGMTWTIPQSEYHHVQGLMVRLFSYSDSQTTLDWVKR